MDKKTTLVTGGAGFIGANFINYYLTANPEAVVINFDKLTYAAAPENIGDFGDRYQLIEGDIAKKSDVENLLSKFNITQVFNFAAESHVDNSIKGPEEFMRSNIMGTFNLLHGCYLKWMDGPFKLKSGCENNRFHHISTDEVYGSLGDEGKFSETTPYAPNSPYSASKASSDFVVRSYFHTFGLNVVTTNCSNNYGPFQHNEKLIPVVIRKALSGEPIPIYGDGKNVRDWLFVKDHCQAIAKVCQEGRSGETYNIGGDEEWSNIDLCKMICSKLDQLNPRSDGKSYSDQITFVKDRPGHDRRYAVDISKISTELGWKPSVDFEEGIDQTVKWYLKLFHG